MICVDIYLHYNFDVAHRGLCSLCLLCSRSEKPRTMPQIDDCTTKRKQFLCRVFCYKSVASDMGEGWWNDGRRRVMARPLNRMIAEQIKLASRPLSLSKRTHEQNLNETQQHGHVLCATLIWYIFEHFVSILANLFLPMPAIFAYSGREPTYSMTSVWDGGWRDGLVDWSGLDTYDWRFIHVTMAVAGLFTWWLFRSFFFLRAAHKALARPGDDPTRKIHCKWEQNQHEMCIEICLKFKATGASKFSTNEPPTSWHIFFWLLFVSIHPTLDIHCVCVCAIEYDMTNSNVCKHVCVSVQIQLWLDYVWLCFNTSKKAHIFHSIESAQMK